MAMQVINACLTSLSAGCVCLLLTLSCAGAGVIDQDYRVGAEDVLKVGTFGYPDLTSDVRVSQSGNITFPLIGQLAVAGLSTGDVEKLIGQRLTDGGFIKNPQVSVLVAEYVSKKIAVMGQVAKPGQYALTSSTKVLDLLAAAGGPLSAIASDSATLMRDDGTRLAIDLRALFDGDLSQNPPVNAGDTIFVPRAPQFYVYGEVQRPGLYRLERNMTVSQAIAAGGGLTARGSEARVIVKRRDGSGEERTIAARDCGALQPDDVLFVKESLF
ncbi:MAG: SLBB domain-containing protein [Steroidobacteraceae bacterium]